MKQIDTSIINGDYRHNHHSFAKYGPFQRENDKRVKDETLFQSQHQQMIKILISLCEHWNNIYHLNILINIALTYHIYIECESYNLILKTSYFIEQEFIN